MKKNVNIVQIAGFLGTKPEFHQFNSGKSMARVSLAFNESYKKDGEQVEKTSWFTLVFWNELAEKAKELLDKGSHIIVHGKLSNHHYEDKDGNSRVTNQFRVNKDEFVEQEKGQPYFCF